MTALAGWGCGPDTGGSSLGVRGRLELSRAWRGHGFSQKTKTSLESPSPNQGYVSRVWDSGSTWQIWQILVDVLGIAYPKY